MEDIPVFSKKLEKHLQHMRGVLELLLKNQLYAKMNKYVFGCNEVEYLGHIQNWFQEDISNARVARINCFEGFKRFLGSNRLLYEGYKALCLDCYPSCYSSRFVQNEYAFQQLKQDVANPPVWTLPYFSKPFTIECDALGVGLGALLMQNQQPIAFHS